MSRSDGRPATIDHIGVVVADLDAAKRLFGDVLGLELLREADHRERDGPRVAWLACGAAEVELVEYGEDDPARGAPVPRVDHLALAVASLPTAMAALGAHGVELAGPPQTVGESAVAFVDPATTLGLRLQLVAPR